MFVVTIKTGALDLAQAMEVTIATQQTNLQRPLSPSTTQVADNTTTPPSKLQRIQQGLHGCRVGRRELREV
jgi:hypothetical protein